MTTRQTYQANVERDGAWWYVFVESVGHSTQARRLDQVEAMVRDLVALVEGVPADSFDVAVTVKLGKTQPIVDDAVAARQRAETSQRAAQEATRAAAQALRERGLPLRDIGDLLGLTHQRVSQLTSG